MIGFKAPNIDRVAKEGISFTNYYGRRRSYGKEPGGTLDLVYTSAIR